LALGGSIKIKHPTGDCEIYLNKCTQPDDYKVVNNVGIPIYYDNEEKQMRKGNMVVVFRLKLPSEACIKNNPDYKKLFEELQKYENMEELNELNGLSGIKI
jgi:DnaJ-class molecular chaperone